jgi:Fur family ferric uptake transcriptional regulator
MECGAVDEITEDLLGDVEKIVEKEWKFLIKDHRLTFHGICHRCRDKQNEDND